MNLIFTPSKLRYVCMSSNGPERELARLSNQTLQPLIDLGMLMISQRGYLNHPMRLQRKILWQREGDEAQDLLDTFDAFYVKAGMNVPVLEGALFLVNDPFAIEQIFCEMQKLRYTDQQMSHYVSDGNMELLNGRLLDARFASFKIVLQELEPDEQGEQDEQEPEQERSELSERSERSEVDAFGGSPKRLKSK